VSLCTKIAKHGKGDLSMPAIGTDTSENPGWDDPEDTLREFPEEEPEHYGPDIPSQGGDFRFTQTSGEAWADADGVEVSLLCPGRGALRFHVDRPLALRLRDALEDALAINPRVILLPDSRPPDLPKCPQPPDHFVLPFTVDDEPRLKIISGTVADRWLYLSLSSRRASLSMQLEDAVAFHLYDWLSDAARTPNTSRRSLGRVLCEVQWPVCPTCLGEPLNYSRGLGSCVWCGGRWLADRTSCSRVATHQLTDIPTGERLFICASHARSAGRALDDVMVERLPGLSWSPHH